MLWHPCWLAGWLGGCRVEEAENEQKNRPGMLYIYIYTAQVPAHAMVKQSKAKVSKAKQSNMENIKFLVRVTLG